ncbi:MAG: TRAP transporter large permease [Pseudomonadota bacterium]
MTGIALVLVVMLALIAFRVPVFLAIGLATVAFAAAFWPIMQPMVVAQSVQRGLDNTAFTAIAYFFLAGAIMNAGGMSARLLRLARALVAHIRGGLSHANIAASMVFAGISGSAVADAAAVGSVMIPAMKRDGYSGAYAAAVTGASATIGLMIPPSIPMVVFALFTPADVVDLFVAGVLPGLLMGVVLLVASVVVAYRRGYPAEVWAGWRELGQAFRGSVLALLMPVLVIAALVGGAATVSEIGALAAVYAAFVSLFIYREARLVELWRATVEAAVDAARVLIIISLSGALVWIAARIGVAPALAEALSSLALPPALTLLVIAVGLLALGTVLEPVTILVVVAPILAPAAILAGIDVTQLGIVFVLACAIGLVTPPVGVLLYLTAAQAGAGVATVARESLVFLLALIALLIAVALWPALTLWLPGIVNG